ncbi:response regulator transcription factor [Actinomyces israelii]
MVAADCRAVVIIDDHQVMGLGVRDALLDAGVAEEVLWLPGLSAAELPEGVVVVLDLRLGDGSSPRANVAALFEAGYPVIVYTSAENPYLVREAVEAGALSIVRKSAPTDELVSAVGAAARGETVPGVDWAAALDADGDFVKEHLTSTEARVLACYASGATSTAVAQEMGLSPCTVNTYVSRIRDKYRAVGRPVCSRVDLFRRAVEDGLLPCVCCS